MNDDVDRIMAVMGAAFDPAFGEAWTRRQVSDTLLLGNCDYALVGAEGASATGFYLSRFAYDEEELLLLAVDPAFRGHGIGRGLLERFARSASARGACRLVLEMRRGNPAEALYREFGFVPVGIRPNYYRLPNGRMSDAITFALDMST